MPNVPPHGLFGSPFDIQRPADSVFVSDGSSWPSGSASGAVLDVHAWDEAAFEWVLVWSAAGSPPQSATASLQGNGSVEITWVPPSPEAADSYEVRRSDGSLVGTVEPGPASIIDDAPLAGAQTWTVTTILGGVGYGSATTNTLNVANNPPTGVGVVWNNGPSGRQAVVSWTVPSPSQGVQFYQLLRPDGSAVSSVAHPGTTITDTDPRPSVGTYSVVCLSKGGDSGAAGDSPAQTIAQPPSGFASVSEAGRTVTFSWSNASVGEHTGFSIDAGSSPGEGATQGTTTYALYGRDDNKQIRAKINNRNGPPVGIGDLSVDPLPATSVLSFFVPPNCMRIAWGAPGDTAIAGWVVESSINGLAWNPVPGSPFPSTLSPLRHDLCDDIWPKYQRVRTLGENGKVSTTVPQGPINPP